MRWSASPASSAAPFHWKRTVRRGADRTRFKEFYAEMDAAQAPLRIGIRLRRPITYTGTAALERDIADIKTALRAYP